MYLLSEIRHTVLKQCHGNCIEGNEIPFVIIRNDSPKNWVSLEDHFDNNNNNNLYFKEGNTVWTMVRIFPEVL